MKCPKCQSEIPDHTLLCNACGYGFESEKTTQHSSAGSNTLGEEPEANHTGDRTVLKPLSGFRRTLSTEMVQKQDGLRVFMALNELIASRTYKPGEAIMRKGESNRDLFFLTEGSVEISMEGEAGNLILNEIIPPYILGDIAFLTGFPRTATAKAKTQVEVFIMKYENLLNLSGQFPEWLHPFLTATASGIKSLHFTISQLKKKIVELEKNREQ